MKRILLLLLLISQIGVFAQPTAYPETLQVCDDDNDGFAVFDLTQADAVVLGSQTPEDYMLTYHSAIVDAENGTNPFSNPTSYGNMSPFSEIVYARVESLETGDFATAPVELMVGITPNVTPYNGIVICSENEFATFDLTMATSTIIGDQNPNTLDVNFYEDVSDAQQNAQNAIATPQDYSNYTNPQEIYVRVENFESGCFSIASFSIEVLNCEDDEDDDLVDNEFEDVGGNADEEERSANFNSPDGNLANDDTDGDGIPNYLDNDDDGDGILTADEDYNNNGDPTDDDTDGSGVPDYLEFSVALSVNSNSLTSFSVYPNPATNQVSIQLNHSVEIESIQIFSISGKLVKTYSVQASGKNQNLSVSQLVAGIYFLQVKSGESISVQKLVIQ